jgi:toxin ParE1/3/4
VNKIYKLYPKAVADLESIYLYSVQEFGQQKADNYIFDIENTFQRLAKDPLIARSCSYIRKDLRVFHVASHSVFFKIADSGIVVIRILHKSMNFQKLL